MAYGQTQTVDQFVLNAYLLATGKAVPPVFGTPKYTKLLALGNFYTQDWAGDPTTDWNSQRAVFTVAGGVTATDTFLIPATVGYISRQEGDFVRIYHSDGVNESDYTIVPHQRLYQSGPAIGQGGIGGRNNVGTCAVIGPNLVFSTAFKATAAQFGGTMKIPGYIIPATLVNASDFISVDNPLWLCCRVAAEYIRNDITRVQLYGSLLDQAAEQMRQMKANNLSQQETSYRGGWNPLPAGEDYPWQ